MNNKVEENPDNEESEIEHLQGLAETCNNLYECRQNSVTVISIATIHDLGNFENYAVIAHEVAHLMTVEHDDSLFMKDGECCGNIMKKKEGRFWCRKCLSWSDVSERKLKEFFMSPNCCTFINKPRSLYPPRPRLMLTADEQCQCYGHKSEMIFETKHKKKCESNMICLDDITMFSKAPIPMDGTPCAHNKVCWNKECVSLTED
ncbi:hypothetical protein PV327_006169 [Microctonus hyperodae]|uniref:ADAMTS cysteine-rich domain-containing protein n=1 Tax=Microctonus hyperodae TaxID=165561 RepID=A0AA39F3Q7_MICHY|nr:hypothetical protein PV327_006169 [Microctonus hyperodae]